MAAREASRREDTVAPWSKVRVSPRRPSEHQDAAGDADRDFVVVDNGTHLPSPPNVTEDFALPPAQTASTIPTQELLVWLGSLGPQRGHRCLLRASLRAL